MVFNHGVNKFNGKFWDEYCKEYEASNQWISKSLHDIALGFKNFIEMTIIQQLDKNAKNFPDNTSVTTSAFVICGKDSKSRGFEFYELYWSPAFEFGYWTDTRIIGSGDCYKKYLKSYLLQNLKSNTTERWGSLDTAQAKEELKRLFLIALMEQRKNSGDDFSETFDIECISD